MEFDFLKMLYTLLPSIGGAAVQATTGFGCGIVVMVFYPLFLSIYEGASLSTMNGIWLNASMAIKYRKSCEYKRIWYPAALYLIVSYGAMYFSKHLSVGSLTAYFGLFLVAVAAYFMFFSERLHIKPGFWMATVCSVISGCANGFFSIGGPPMALYFLAVAGDDKLRYLGTLQMFFLLTGIGSVVSRFANGMVTAELIPLIIPGILGMIIGQKIGGRIIDRINIIQLKRIIYIFLAVAGAVTFAKSIL